MDLAYRFETTKTQNPANHGCIVACALSLAALHENTRGTTIGAKPAMQLQRLCSF
jgi:hypothetical protein